jgi:hypothetical protein
VTLELVLVAWVVLYPDSGIIPFCDAECEHDPINPIEFSRVHPACLAGLAGFCSNFEKRGFEFG